MQVSPSQSSSGPRSSSPRYEAPQSIEEAVVLLGAGDARVLAGGTDLLVQMTSGARRPATVINVKRIPELVGIHFADDGTLHLGAAVCAAEIAENSRVRAAYPGLAEGIALIGSDQIQGRASVGGNLCNASPAADTVPSLFVLGARCRIAGPRGSERTIPVRELVTGPGKTSLAPGELLVELVIPSPAPRSADAYLRMIPRTEMDIAVVGAGVSVTLDDAGTCTGARVALGAVAPTVIEAPDAAAALVGTQLDEADLEGAAELVRAACHPIDDKRGTAKYRRNVAGVLFVRAARSARIRAQER
jgi:CO/xanthine dehydrogenase FAD-binding subunit